MALTDLGTGVQYFSGQPYYDNVLTNWFLDNFPDAKNNGSVLLQMIERQSKESVAGRYIIFPISYGRNTGVQNIGLPLNFSGTPSYPIFPEAGRQNYATASTRTRVGMMSIQLDGTSMAHGKTNGGAFAEAAGLEASKVMDDMKMDRARQVHNDGSGRLGEIVSVGAGTAILRINSSIEGAATTRAAGTIDQTGWLDVGQRVAFCSNAGVLRNVNASGQQGVFITAIAVSGNNVQITLSLTPGGATLGGMTNVVVNDWVIRAPSTVLTQYNQTSYRNELTGIGGIFSDTGVLDGGGASGTQQSAADDFTSTSSTLFQGISVTNNAWNQAVVLDNGGSGNRPISVDLLQQALSDAEKRNNAQVQMFLSSFETYNAYVSIALADKRYVNTTELKTGHTVLDFNGVPWFKDRFCYQNRVYMPDLSPLKLLETLSIQDAIMPGMPVWERVLSSGQPTEMYRRSWKWEDQLAVCDGPRERMGAVLVELSS